MMANFHCIFLTRLRFVYRESIVNASNSVHMFSKSVQIVGTYSPYVPTSYRYIYQRHASKAYMPKAQVQLTVSDTYLLIYSCLLFEIYTNCTYRFLVVAKLAISNLSVEYGHIEVGISMQSWLPQNFLKKSPMLTA